MKPGPALRRTLVGLGAAAVVAGAAYVATRALARRIRAAPDPYAGDDDAFPPDCRHEEFTTRDGARLHVIVREPSSNGGRTRPLVLLHGVGLQAGIWRYQFGDLADRFRVIAVDTRGHGGSTVGSDGYGLEPAACDLAEVIGAMDLRDAIVVGHSMGGMVLMRFAIDHRDVLHDRVAGLVFLATSPHLGVPAPIASAALAWADRSSHWDGARIKVPLDRFSHSDLSYVLTRIGFGTDPLPSHIELTRRMLSEVPLHAFVPSGLRLLSHNAGEALAGTDTPSRVVVGTRDRITPPRLSEALAEILPDAQLIVLPGAGHQLMLERRHELADLLSSFDAELAAARAD